MSTSVLFLGQISFHLISSVQRQGGNISLAKRGKFGVVSGSIEGWFSPYHVSISASSTEDLNPESIKQTVS